MAKSRIRKAEEIYQEFAETIERADHINDFLGPSLNSQQLYGRANSLWSALVAELSKSAANGSAHAQKLSMAIAAMNKLGNEHAFVDAWNKYLMDVAVQGLDAAIII